jgi:hypothetical protein
MPRVSILPEDSAISLPWKNRYSLLFLSLSSLRLRRLLVSQNGPDKSDKLPSDGHHDDIVMFQVSFSQTIVSFMETVLSSIGNANHGFWLSLPDPPFVVTDRGGMAIVPSGLDQNTPNMRVSSFRNASPSNTRRARMFARRQSQKRHQIPWMVEASDVIELGKDGHGCNRVDSP